MSSSRTRLLASLLNESNIIKPSLAPASLEAGNVTTYSSIDSLPLTGNTNGDQALITSTNTLYIFSNGWYKIALINSTPYWSTEAASSYDLSTTGASTVITILATDSEGVPITYTATTDSDFNQIATVTKDSDNGRTFTIIPTDSENGLAVAGSGIITFKASDGVNLVSTLSTFSITFDPNWANPTGTKLAVSNLSAADRYGFSVAISGDGNYAIVGSEREDTGGGDRGGAYIYLRSGSSWSEQALIQASDAANGDYFGTSVSISTNGTYAIAGAYGVGTFVGAAYVFTRSGSTWTQQAKLTASDAQTSDYFGELVAISGDGNYAIVGAQYEDGGSGDPALDAGAVYVYVRSGSSWSEQAILRASDAEASDRFGNSIEINSDGSYIIVGARLEDTTFSGAGSAYIFTRSGSTWTQQAKIQASNAGDGDGFGYSVAISGDGNYAISGAFFEDTGGSNTGSAYIFSRSGSTWTQQQQIQSTNVNDNDRFGTCVSMNSDGTYVVVGAGDAHIDSDGINNIVDTGQGYIFKRDGSTWSQVGVLTAPDAQAYDNLGGTSRAASISDDGAYAILGAWNEDGGAGDPLSNAGAAYIFEAG